MGFILPLAQRARSLQLVCRTSWRRPSKTRNIGMWLIFCWIPAALLQAWLPSLLSQRSGNWHRIKRTSIAVFANFMKSPLCGIVSQSTVGRNSSRDALSFVSANRLFHLFDLRSRKRASCPRCPSAKCCKKKMYSKQVCPCAGWVLLTNGCPFMAVGLQVLSTTTGAIFELEEALPWP